MLAPLLPSASRLALAAVAAALLASAGCGEGDQKLRVTGLEPRTGDATGGTRLAIKGNNFQKVQGRTARIYFGDERGTVLRFVDDETLLVEAPGGKPGEPVDVLVVFEPGGEITIPRAFTFVDRTPMNVRDLAPR
jgi:hypothetical protein